MNQVHGENHLPLGNARAATSVPVSLERDIDKELRAQCATLFIDLAKALTDDPRTLAGYLPDQLQPAIDACQVFASAVSSVPVTAGSVDEQCTALFRDLAKALTEDPRSLDGYSQQQLQAAIDACRPFAIPVAELKIIDTTAPARLGAVAYIPPVFQTESGAIFGPPYGLYGAHVIAPQQVAPKRLTAWAATDNLDGVDFQHIAPAITGQPDHCLWQDAQGRVHYQPAKAAALAIKEIHDCALAEARRLLQEGNAKQAARQAELAFSADPSDNAHMLLAHCHLRQGERKLADGTIMIWANARSQPHQATEGAEGAISSYGSIGAYMVDALWDLHQGKVGEAKETLTRWQEKMSPKPLAGSPLEGGDVRRPAPQAGVALTAPESDDAFVRKVLDFLSNGDADGAKSAIMKWGYARERQPQQATAQAEGAVSADVSVGPYMVSILSHLHADHPDQAEEAFMRWQNALARATATIAVQQMTDKMREELRAAYCHGGWDALEAAISQSDVRGSSRDLATAFIADQKGREKGNPSIFSIVTMISRFENLEKPGVISRLAQVNHQHGRDGLIALSRAVYLDPSVPENVCKPSAANLEQMADAAIRRLGKIRAS